MFAVRDIVISAVTAGVLAAFVLAAAWPWARRRGRFVVAGMATMAGFIAWNLILNGTHATGFDVDGPILSLSWQDAGSGIFAFALTAFVLGLIAERSEAANRVVGAAAIAGLVAMLFDIFVL
jgi:hypothetical protein